MVDLMEQNVVGNILYAALSKQSVFWGSLLGFCGGLALQEIKNVRDKCKSLKKDKRLFSREMSYNLRGYLKSQEVLNQYLQAINQGYVNVETNYNCMAYSSLHRYHALVSTGRLYEILTHEEVDLLETVYRNMSYIYDTLAPAIIQDTKHAMSHNKCKLLENNKVSHAQYIRHIETQAKEDIRSLETLTAKIDKLHTK